VAKAKSRKSYAKKSYAKKPAKPAKKKSRASTKAKPARHPLPQKSARLRLPQGKPIGGFPQKLHEAALKVLKDRQAEEIVSVSLGGRSSMADYLIIASGRASRQLAAIADYLREAFMKLGVQRVRVEGMSEANWVLVDAGDVVVHLFRPEVRQYYRLDEIWNDEEKDIEKSALLIE